MAQNFLPIAATDTLQASREVLTDRDEAAASSFSGTGFPTTNLLVGMRCHRTDLNKIYVLKTASPATWVEVEDVSGSTGLVPQATKLATARNIAIGGDITTPNYGFDGTAPIIMTATLANSGVTAGTYTKVTVDAKGRVTTATNIINSDLPASGVTAGTYTKVTVNDRGVVTSATTLTSNDLPSSPAFFGQVSATRLISTLSNAVDLSTTDAAIQVGVSTMPNLALDGGTVQARNNGAAATLQLNRLGGNITLGGTGTVTTINGTISGSSPAVATSAEAEAGTLNTKVMTPLMVAQAIASRFSALKVSAGYQVFASGVILQWGSCDAGGSTTFPIAFPTACLRAVVCDNDDGNPNALGCGFTRTAISVNGEASGTGHFIAIGH